MLRNWCASGSVEYYNEWIPLDRVGKGTTTEIDRSLADHWMAIAKYFLDPRITRLQFFPLMKLEDHFCFQSYFVVVVQHLHSLVHKNSTTRSENE